MEEKIQAKIDAIIDRIISKPTEEITLDDYTILSSELKDIRFRKSQEETNEQFRKSIMALTSGGFSHE